MEKSSRLACRMINEMMEQDGQLLRPLLTLECYKLHFS